jgi:ComF family protein
MVLIDQIKNSFLHLVFPHVCEGCGSDVVDDRELLCLKCIGSLPKTGFQFHSNNIVEKMFWGRLPVREASAQYYFTKESMMQHLMHQLKYKGNKELGIYLGNLMGLELEKTNRFSSIDALIPLPLFPSKEKKRGYNQAAVLCYGISEIIGKPVLENVVIRTLHTETQTRKNRVARWQNMEGRFLLNEPSRVAYKHVLLVDDVITTGASLEACGQEILKAEGTSLSICTLCYSSHI